VAPAWKPAAANSGRRKIMAERVKSTSPDSQPQSVTALPNQPTSSVVRALSATGAVIGRYRWVICALLLFGTTKNYMDRQVMGVLKTTLQHDRGWSEIDYGNLVFAFQTFYAIGMLFVGRLVDRIGTRKAYSIAMVFWSLASMGHAIARSFTSFLVARSALGLGESALFPASLKAVAEWFPKKERAFATGIFNAGTNIGAIITPLIVPWITIHLGWRWAFVFIGALGFVWLGFWLALYRKPEEHPRCSAAELQYITAGREESTSRIPWVRLLPLRQTWAFIVGKFLIDPVWWFYLFWTPDFLQRRYGLPLSRIGVPIMVIYLISDAGSIGGGWLSSWMIRRGSTINTGRKIAMLACAILVTPVIFADRTSGMWGAVLLIGLAAAAHQGFSANLYTLPSDTFPNYAVGSVVGIGGMAGAVGGMLMAKAVGSTLQSTGSYRIPLLVAGMAYLIALGLIQLLVPKLAPANLRSETST
jgi:ACS family hexuronate transporter-like MFS transporter